MTLESRRRIAKTLKEIVHEELTRDWALPHVIRRGVRALAEHAQRMGMLPEDVLTPDGRDAFTMIARAIGDRKPSAAKRLCAEWQTVIQLAA